MKKNISEMANINIIIDVDNYDINQDKRYLVPFMSYKITNIKLGFANKTGRIVIPAIYDRILDDFKKKSDCVRVGKICIEDNNEHKIRKKLRLGLINYYGKEIIPCKYLRLEFATSDKTSLIAFDGNTCALLDLFGDEIIPFGVYNQIDTFVRGYARVMTINHKNIKQYGIIDTEGREILPLEYSIIWKISNKYDSIFTIRDREEKRIYFSQLDILKENKDFDDYHHDEYASNIDYGEYAGSYAQDVMGYSDDFIDDAFDGCPDAYWNID